MKIINEFPFEYIEDEIALALGFFDGFHLGHKEIIEGVKNSGYKSGVLTFDKHPFEVLSGKENLHTIMTLEEKIDYLSENNIDYLFIIPFEKIKNLKAEEFIKFLMNFLNVKKIITGFNYTFGKEKLGDVHLLKEFSKAYNFDYSVMDKVTIGREIVSSTLIRKYLARGDIEKVNTFLGRYYKVRGKVFKGKQLGRTIEVPTANILIKNQKNPILKGVYASITEFKGKKYYGISNVGTNPTFNDGSLRCETFLFDFSEDIYGEEITVSFVYFIRPEKKFSGIDELKEQINKDIISTKKKFKLL